MTQTRCEVVVVGNAGLDTNVYFHSDEPDFSREANFTENLDTVGQAGGYASRGYAQLGKRTAFIGYVGDDFSGRFLREELARDGIDQSAVFVDPAGTSRSINFMYRDGRRKNFYDGKSHLQLQPDLAACRSVLEQSRLAHFNIPNWARLLLPIARELGVTVACDLQDVVTLHDGYREDFIDYADMVFFSAVIHIQSGEENRRLIEKSFRALNPEGLVVIQDFVMDEDRTAPPGGAVFALNMLVNTASGDTYTESEIRDWLEGAGFAGIIRQSTGADTSMVIGRKPSV
jgi:sugar/nucleoside kinase (ribokinase family)